jgi:uncharacterized membrane protein
MKYTVKSRLNEDSFTKDLRFYKLFWIFFIGCLIGVMVETLWCILAWHKIENRSGLIHLPLNPVYGLGAVLLTYYLIQIPEKRYGLIFLSSMILGGTFEYVCSFVQEVFVGTVSWQYNKSIFSIHGRTDLIYALFWGFLGVAWIYWVFPQIRKYIEWSPNTWGRLLTLFLLLLLLADLTISALAVSRQTERNRGIPAKSSIDVFLDKHYPNEYLMQAYPNMQIVDFEKSLHIKGVSK